MQAQFAVMLAAELDKLRDAEEDLTEARAALKALGRMISAPELEADAQAKLSVAEAELVVTKAKLGVAEAKLNVAETPEEIAKAELAVAEARLAVAEARLAVAEARLVVAKAEWANAKGDDKFILQASVTAAQGVVLVAIKAYEAAIPAAGSFQGVGAAHAGGQGSTAHEGGQAAQGVLRVATKAYETALSAAGSSQDVELRQRLNAVEKEMEEQRRIIPLASAVFFSAYAYSEGLVTSQKRGTHFKRNLRGYYGVPRSTCMLLGNDLKAIRGSHLFKHAWNKPHQLKMLGLDNIDDPRNGLLLFRPVEWAFDSARLSFIPIEDTFYVHIFDPQILEVPLVEFAAWNWETHKRQVSDWAEWDTNTGAISANVYGKTFGDLQGIRLQFTNVHRPFKRVLCFQANMAQYAAQQEGLTTCLPPEKLDTWSEGDYKTTVRLWLSQCQPQEEEQEQIGQIMSEEAPSTPDV